MFAHGSYAQLGTTLKSSDTRVLSDVFATVKCEQRAPSKMANSPRDSSPRARSPPAPARTPRAGCSRLSSSSAVATRSGTRAGEGTSCPRAPLWCESRTAAGSARPSGTTRRRFRLGGQPPREVRRHDLEHEPVVSVLEPIASRSRASERREKPRLVLEVALAPIEVGQALMKCGEVVFPASSSPPTSPDVSIKSRKASDKS